MEIEELWSAGLNACFDDGLEQVRALYQRDEEFAEMCRDFVELQKLAHLDLTKNAHVVECLLGLKAEIQTRFRRTQPINDTTPRPPVYDVIQRKW